VKGWKKIFHARGNQKRASVAILIPYKMDVEPKMVSRDREGNYIVTKGSIHQDVKIKNTYDPTLKYLSILRNTNRPGIIK